MIDFKRLSKPRYTELPSALPVGPPPWLCSGLTGGLQHSADPSPPPPPLLILSCLQCKKRSLPFYKLNLEHKNSGMTKWLEKPLDSNLSKPIKIMTSELLFLTLLLFFCRSSNKSVLEWFLLIINKEYNLTRSTNLLSRNHPTSCFWLRKDAQYLLLTLWLEVHKQPFADVLQNKCSKNVTIFTRKHLCWNLFNKIADLQACNFIKK